MDWQPCIVAVAPNGARRTKADHPALPMTPDEIAREAASCLDAGAAFLHLHVRDSAGGHTIDPDSYRAGIEAVRGAVGQRMVIQVTTEAVGIYQPDQQIAAIKDLVPEAVSLAIREIAPDAAHEPAAADFFAWLRRENVLTQYILYSADEVSRFNEMQRRGMIPDEDPCVIYVLGRYAEGQRSNPEELLPFLQARGELSNDRWFLCAFGPKENACMTTAAALGGHARIGFENNLWLNDGSVAPDNAALIGQFTRTLEHLGRPIADADQIRALLSQGD